MIGSLKAKYLSKFDIMSKGLDRGFWQLYVKNNDKLDFEHREFYKKASKCIDD
jgi:hypothetical protein